MSYRPCCVRAERSRSTDHERAANGTSFDFAQDERGGEPQAGFTLIEALVALAIVAIAAAGLIGATERHIDTVTGIERRTAARWIAENRLAEMALAGDSPGSGEGPIEMLGQPWRVATTSRASADPDLSLVEVAVSPANGAPLVRLRGFVDTGTHR
ncbi:type II secretion system minor pseudopilin GspI [Sphingomonas sp. BIUV-7]|uniref:Type II secretion system protein I n=1 Tax=Sphingomonas natans TaxID=3063330 RepID=A0ABT8Y5L0_9SPHN|nr:type II secretion system minor pseudopilin GspI [Sphingomonas sp. BIUV-7]MDO6413612.1 type II secretion system minor pseudopilin GspI [Sphingomonas sp. BIUV-7]